jgi:glycosyltransferase involved in cell wall biosynthesis
MGAGADVGARPLRIAILWTTLSGYVAAELRALVDEGVEVLLFHRAAHDTAPFDYERLGGGYEAIEWSDAPDQAQLAARLDAFGPDALLVCSWHIAPYRRVARRFAGRALRIVAMDNPWLRTARQVAGVVVSPLVLRPAYDAVLLPDERSMTFAAKLGFPLERSIWGMNTCDVPLFAEVADQRRDALPPRQFLFVGRLVEDKAVDILAAGYESYRDQVDDPWPLLVAGAGPQATLLEGIPGVEMLGFVQPDDLPKVFATAGCLVLPSRFEPWAVVVHEATVAGLPVVCSQACGAAARLVLDGYNGVVFTPGKVDAFRKALLRVHRATDGERRAMGQASLSLAGQYTPQRWAQNLVRRVHDLRLDLGLRGSSGSG